MPTGNRHKSYRAIVFVYHGWTGARRAMEKGGVEENAVYIYTEGEGEEEKGDEQCQQFEAA